MYKMSRGLVDVDDMLIVIFDLTIAESELVEAIVINLFKIRLPRTYIIFPFLLELLGRGIVFLSMKLKVIL